MTTEDQKSSNGSPVASNGPLHDSQQTTDRTSVDPSTTSTQPGTQNGGNALTNDVPRTAEQTSSSELNNHDNHDITRTGSNGSRLLRTTSAPSALEQAESTDQEDEPLNASPIQLNTVTEGRSMPAVSTYDRDATTSNSPASRDAIDPPVTSMSDDLHPMSREAFEHIINSPRGESSPIVERSPGGRYVRFNEKLGSGASKDVYRAYDTAEGIEVAWNVVQLSGVPKAERNRIVNEVRLLERLHHPNIISFHGSWVNRERQEVNFVTEILSSGTLASFIEKVQVIRWKIAKRWAVQILKGLEYLHSQDPPVIHRDLKCENIFINGTSGDLRIGDLGLSTVHRNGKVLSVLGTPEFMAPDLYEESAYDEKVDIYAFGMCLLEILTKEIPYRECSNPAQIYKKVMRGERPESLSRLRSKMAQDFIVLCLGVKDEATGNYTRPSATDLLTYPFLAKSADDESEVMVGKPLQRNTIFEDPLRSQPSNASTDGSGDNNQNHVPLPVSRRKSESHEDDSSDQFNEMPTREENIKNVKVMVGRNEELKEDDSSPIPPATQVASESTNSAPIPAAIPPSGETAPTGSATPPLDAASAASQFIVAAKVSEDKAAVVVPNYEDDVLKLIITLPVDGQTQNVQFDFHLVEDDPVEVAREMVSELGIPQEAVLEIGGTVSGLAREARIQQGKHRRQMESTGVSGSPPSNPTLAARPPSSIALQSAATAADQSTTPPTQSSVPATPQRDANSTAAAGASVDGNEEEDEDDVDRNEVQKQELRQLDEDFRKNLTRARKVFDNRMDNLHRSKLEKEQQHQKQLEKHEKERLEFERRVQQEEKEQQQRLQKMQLDWEEKRKTLAKKQSVAGAPAFVQQAGARSSLASSASHEALSSLSNANSVPNSTSESTQPILSQPTSEASL